MADSLGKPFHIQWLGAGAGPHSKDQSILDRVTPESKRV